MSATRKKDVKLRKAVSIMPQQGAIKKIAALERLRIEHAYIRSRLNNPERWLPFLELRYPRIDPGTALKQMQNRLVEIRDLRAKASNYRPTISAIQAMISAGQAEAGESVYGTVEQATAQFCFLPDAGGPTGNCPVIALRLVGGHWEPTWPELPSNAVSYAAYQECGDKQFNRWESVWFVPCLQFTFPAPRLDCTLYWSVILQNQIGFELDADWGWVNFQSVIKEQPSGGSFPSFEELLWDPNTYYINESIGPNSMQGWYWPINGAFEVKKDTQSNLYIGLGVQLAVHDGCVGIPNCSEGKNATINSDLWGMGLFTVWGAETVGYPMITNGKLGVKYSMYLHD